MTSSSSTALSRSLMDGFDIQDAQNTLAAGHGGLPGGEHHAQLQHRLKQAGRIAQERHDDTQGQRVARSTARPPNQRIIEVTSVLSSSSHRRKGRSQPDGRDVRIAVGAR